MSLKINPGKITVTTAVLNNLITDLHTDPLQSDWVRLRSMGAYFCTYISLTFTGIIKCKHKFYNLNSK